MQQHAVCTLFSVFTEVQFKKIADMFPQQRVNNDFLHLHPITSHIELSLMLEHHQRHGGKHNIQMIQITTWVITLVIQKHSMTTRVKTNHCLFQLKLRSRIRFEVTWGSHQSELHVFTWVVQTFCQISLEIHLGPRKNIVDIIFKHDFLSYLRKKGCNYKISLRHLSVTVTNGNGDFGNSKGFTCVDR